MRRIHAFTLVIPAVIALLVLAALLAGSGARAALSVEEALISDPPDDPEYPAGVVELSIDSAGYRLPAHLYLASGKGPHPTFVLLHGLPGHERNLDVAQALRRVGFNTLFFSYRGAWGAEGPYRFTQLPQDALNVLAYLRQPLQSEALRIDPARLSVLGHSLGGFTALATGAQDPELRCVVALAPANLALWQSALLADAPEARANAERLMAYSDTLFMLRGLSGARFREEMLAAPVDLLDTRGFGPGLRDKSVLMMVGTEDSVTPAATMFDPVVHAYAEAGVVDLTAKKLPGAHSFSASRVALTREVLTWADQRCR